MRVQIPQIVAALLAALAFCLAFMAAGILIVSTLFMGLGLAAIAWLAWSLIRQVRSRTRNPVA
ncbi:hypothetical protein [uncultured Brevundimonas sp.]|uniref:hypothetical protein n=1 Tax=uncultured Brevundimonas sp. TaxID=213418 RepID=UPI0030ED619D|tara:strand:+ start:838 stop:1026 length:189 start_codon:yes stop_codon:yes gene_type:complete